MSSVWHRATIYLGLREDPDRDLRVTDEVEEAGPALELFALALASGLTVFFIHLFTGGDMSAGSILVGAVILFLLTSIFRAIAGFIGHRAPGSGAPQRESRDEESRPGR